MAPLFVFAPDEAIAVAARQAIGAFESKPPIDDEADLEDVDAQSAAKRTGSIWASVANPETYRARAGEQEGQLIVEHVSPHSQDADVVAVQARALDMSTWAGLAMWAEECFKAGRLSGDLTVAGAVARAKTVDRSDLFGPTPHGSLIDLAQGGVAGVAAAVLRFGSPTADEAAWAREILLRAMRTPEPADVPFSSGSIVMHHPCVFAARGLAALVGLGQDAQDAAEGLLSLAMHPLEAVSAGAIGEAMGCWTAHRTLAWTALDLGIRLSIGRFGDRTSAYGYDHTSNRQRMMGDGSRAIGRLRAATFVPDLTDLPVAWEREPAASMEKGLRSFRRKHSESTGWREPETFLRWDFLPKIMDQIPMADILVDSECAEPFRRFCDQMLTWTIEKLAPPSLSDSKNQRAKRQTADLWEWRASLGRFLASLGLCMPAEDFRMRYLDPIFRLHDELAFSLVGPLAARTSTVGVLDPGQVVPSAIPTLEASLGRLLAADAWEAARCNDGSLYGYHLDSLVRDLLFVQHLHAPGAARFANGVWADLPLVLPTIEKLVLAHGVIPIVARSFLTLVRSAGGAFPHVLFAELVSTMVTREGLPPGWRDWDLPAQLAETVQSVGQREHPLDKEVARKLLRVLDALVDMGDRRSAALQASEVFKDIRLN